MGSSESRDGVVVVVDGGGDDDDGDDDDGDDDLFGFRFVFFFSLRVWRE